MLVSNSIEQVAYRHALMPGNRAAVDIDHFPFSFDL
jgi:hypothetical protein